MVTGLFNQEYAMYVGRSVKGGFWRWWGTLTAAQKGEEACGYENQSLIGLMQYLVNKKVLQHKVVVLWRARTAWYKDYAPPPMWQQVWLELWYGKKLLQDHLVVINSAAFGLWDGPPRKPKKQRPLTHEQFLADEARYKEAQRKYNQSKKGKETRRNYQQSEECKEAHRQYNQSEEGKAAKAQKVECGCGAKVSSRNMARHCRQAKHKRWLEEAERVGPALS